jgi:VWFA-related protein
MRRLTASFVCALACAGLAVRAQNPLAQQAPPPAQQAPPPAQQTPPPGAPAQPQQQQPIFRGEIDVIRVDVSVLDKDRRPIRGLKLEDFTVHEDGKPQRLVAVSEIDAATNDPVPSAWMRNTPRDVAANNLGDQIGDGRVVAIVMDDWNIPFDDLDMIMNARSVGRYIIDALSPSDVAAVIFPQQAGKTQDFTDDRRKLVAAVEKFDPPEVRWIDQTPLGTSGGGADMPYRSSPALMRSQCQRSQPTVPTLDTIASRLATIPNRRKTVFFVSTGVPLNFGATRDCPAELADIMRDVFRRAQRASINIYSIDPSGYRGYENYLQNPIRRNGRPAERVANERGASASAKVRRDFLEITADHTGARAIVNDNEVGAEIDQIFEEAGAYYLVGYQTSNGKPDGKFRRLEVKVNRPGATVRTRSGYYAPKEGTLANPDKGMPTQNDLGLTGMMTPAALPLRTTVIPVARTAGSASREVDVAVVLTVRLPPTRAPLSETLTLVRTLYDATGRAGPPLPEKLQLTVPPAGGDEVRYDVYQRLTLAPGRYSIRLNATSTALDRSGSVYADIEVPDFTRPALSASGLVIGSKPAGAARTDVLASVLPVVPTSARDFAANDQSVAFLRFFQGGEAPIVPVTVATQILDASDTKVFEASGTIAPTAFDGSRSAPFEIPLPLEKLRHGPYLLSITATLPGGASTRRDLVFRMR